MGSKIQMNRYSFSVFLAMAVVFTLYVSAQNAVYAQTAAYKETIYLTAGKAETVELPQPVSDLLIASPSVADVGVLRSNRLYVVGRNVGDTNVLAFDESGNVLADLSIHVHIDENTLTETITEFFPDENINIKTVGDNIVLTGQVTTPSVANQVRDLASRFRVNQDQEIVDLMRVAGEQQVMLQVRILEADRSLLRELSINTGLSSDSGTTIGSNGAFLSANAGVGLTAPQPFATGTLLLTDSAFGQLNVNLQALERDGFINTLAEPNLTAISGETAGFLAGGEFPVPTGVDNQGRVQIEFKRFGVSLDFRPIVLSKNRISLQLSTEVSALSDQQNVTLGTGINIPGLTVRRANTTVEMSSGSSLMIAGLIQSQTTNALNGLPGISSIPILGDLFQSKSFARDETELLVMVTPYLVNTFAEPNADLVVESVQEDGSALDRRLLATMTRTYGDIVPAAAEGNASLGYMID